MICFQSKQGARDWRTREEIGLLKRRRLCFSVKTTPSEMLILDPILFKLALQRLGFGLCTHARPP